MLKKIYSNNYTYLLYKVVALPVLPVNKETTQNSQVDSDNSDSEFDFDGDNQELFVHRNQTNGGKSFGN